MDNTRRERERSYDLAKGTDVNNFDRETTAPL